MSGRACTARSYDTHLVRQQFNSKEHHESRVTAQALVISKGAKKAVSARLGFALRDYHGRVSQSEIPSNPNTRERALSCLIFLTCPVF